MTKLNQIYKCNVCGNITKIIHASNGTLVCCNQDMVLLEAGKTDAAEEKHVPIIEKTEKGFKVKVGEVDHPMETDHYIEWIEIIADGKSYMKHLNPGDKPEVEFCIEAEDVTAREYCNLHGLWKS